MKKIILSIAIIGIVGVATAGMTFAYFSDDETSVGNTFTAGTIDIKVDGDNPWTNTYTIPDIKPGETDYVSFGIENVGENPAEIYKRIYEMVGTTGIHTFSCADISTDVSSDPECRAAQNDTDGDLNNLETQIFYDLSVKIYASETDYNEGNGTPIWWQTIEAGNNTLAEVYSTNTSDDLIDLGMLPVGGYMFVEQSYHFNSAAGNIYQGDVLTFNMEIIAEQLAQDPDGNATVTLENKGGAPDWTINDSDTVLGTLIYKTKSPSFEYSFSGKTNTGSIDYTLIYVGTTGDYPCPGSRFIGYATADNDGMISLTGTLDLGIDINSGKFWLVPSSTYNNGSHSDGEMTAWNHVNNLYEVGLVNYDDTDI